MHLSMQKAMQRCNRHRPAAILDPTRRIIFEEADTEGSHEAMLCNLINYYLLTNLAVVVVDIELV